MFIVFFVIAVFVELMKNGFELGTDYGRSRQKKDFLKWAKKRRCSVSREELIGFICNKTNSANYHRPLSGKHNGGRQELSSPRISRDESDFNIQPFKEANFQGKSCNKTVKLKSAPLGNFINVLFKVKLVNLSTITLWQGQSF